MCRIQTITGLPKNYTKKINNALRTIYYTSKTTSFPEVITFFKTQLQPGELLHMDFAFYNVTLVLGFTSMITVVCEKTIIIWFFPTSSKISPVCIIFFILATFNNE